MQLVEGAEPVGVFRWQDLPAFQPPKTELETALSLGTRNLDRQDEDGEGHGPSLEHQRTFAGHAARTPPVGRPFPAGGVAAGAHGIVGSILGVLRLSNGASLGCAGTGGFYPKTAGAQLNFLVFS